MKFIVDLTLTPGGMADIERVEDLLLDYLTSQTDLPDVIFSVNSVEARP